MELLIPSFALTHPAPLPPRLSGGGSKALRGPEKGTHLGGHAGPGCSLLACLLPSPHFLLVASGVLSLPERFPPAGPFTGCQGWRVPGAGLSAVKVEEAVASRGVVAERPVGGKPSCQDPVLGCPSLGPRRPKNQPPRIFLLDFHPEEGRRPAGRRTGARLCPHHLQRLPWAGVHEPELCMAGGHWVSAGGGALAGPGHVSHPLSLANRLLVPASLHAALLVAPCPRPRAALLRCPHGSALTVAGLAHCFSSLSG